MDNEVLTFTPEEMEKISKDFLQHIKNNPDDGRCKMPKHWMKITTFSPPRSGYIYKGYQCACGYEFYFRREKDNDI